MKGVVNSAAYAGRPPGRRGRDPGHQRGPQAAGPVRLDRAPRAGRGAARRGAAGVRAPRPGHRGRGLAHQRPKLERYGDSLFVVLRTAHLDRVTGRSSSARPTSSSAQLHRVGPARGVPLLREVRARCEANPGCSGRARLRPLRDHGLHRGPVLPGGRRARGRARAARGGHLPADQLTRARPSASTSSSAACSS